MVNSKRRTLSDEGFFYGDIFIIIIVALFLRILPVLFGCESADMVMYRQQANPVLGGQNIYQATHRVFPYSPLSMWIPALFLLLSIKFNLPFYIIMKTPALLGDIFLSVAIYYWLIRFKKNRSLAFRGGLLYAANPIAILISAFQGNFMSIPTLFTFLAVVVLLYDPDNNYRLSALLLGLGIGFRGFPVLFLAPIFLAVKISLPKKISYLGYAILPVAILCVPFLLLNSRAMLGEIFGYSGFSDFGLTAIIWNLTFLINNPELQSLSDKLVLILTCWSKLIFVFVYGIILLLRNSLNLIKTVLLICLGFYFFYTGVSSQYFIWVIPFLYFLKDKISKYYIILGTYALLSFYFKYHPEIIFGRFNPDLAYATKVLFINLFVAQLLFWGLCGIWFFKLFFQNDEAK